MKTAVKERPILFSGPMVRALLAGHKTQTRRVIKNPDWMACLTGDCPHDLQSECDESLRLDCSHGQPGDRLWVRETWGYFGGDEYLYQRCRESVGYAATYLPLQPVPGGKWRPSIHMPRWASRITLEITDVRVQRIQEIDARDAWQEGVRPDGVSEFAGDGTLDAVEPTSATIDAFRILWESINGNGSWESNPWVWVITFRRCDDV